MTPFDPLETPQAINAALTQLGRSDEAAALPEWAWDRLDTLQQEPIGLMLPGVMWTLYAVLKVEPEAIGPQGLAVMGQAAQKTAFHRQGVAGQDGTAAAIELIARRERAETGDWPDPETDPPHDPAFAPAVEPEPEPEPDPE